MQTDSLQRDKIKIKNFNRTILKQHHFSTNTAKCHFRQKIKHDHNGRIILPSFFHENYFPSSERKELTSKSSSEEKEGEVEREDILLSVFPLLFWWVTRCVVKSMTSQKKPL